MSKKVKHFYTKVWEEYGEEISKNSCAALLKSVLVCIIFSIGMLYLGAKLAVLGPKIPIHGILYYLAVVFAAFAVLFLSANVYAWARRRSKSFFLKVVLVFYQIILFSTFFITIPIFVCNKILELLINYSAKTFNNFETFWIILAIDFVILVIAMLPDAKLAYLVADFMTKKVLAWTDMEISESALFVLFILMLLKIEIDFINWLILGVISYWRKRESRKQSKKVESQWIKHFNPNRDLMVQLKTKYDTLEKEGGELEESRLYEIDYLRLTLRKVQLLVLIFVFIFATFVPSFFMEPGDVINVVTVFTLAMLYFDKRKEWKANKKV